MSTLIRRHSHLKKNSGHAFKPGNLIWLASVGMIAGLMVLLLVSRNSVSPNNLPDFTEKTLTGETVQLSDYRGQVVMLNFWATWCPPCRAEMPTIEAAYERYQDQGFTVLAINNAESPAQIQPFATELGLQFPIILDTDARLQRQFNITGYPTSIFINAAGEIYATHTGALSEQQLMLYIEKVREAK